jgi:hypothetical protein
MASFNYGTYFAPWRPYLLDPGNRLPYGGYRNPLGGQDSNIDLNDDDMSRLATGQYSIRYSLQVDNRERFDTREYERNYPSRYDEPPTERDPEYPFQDFNYGP